MLTAFIHEKYVAEMGYKNKKNARKVNCLSKGEAGSRASRIMSSVSINFGLTFFVLDLLRDPGRLRMPSYEIWSSIILLGTGLDMI